MIKPCNFIGGSREYVQLVLPVSFSKENEFTTFIEGDNGASVAHIKSVLTQPDNFMPASQRICMIDGSSGVGKTHLLLAITEMAQRKGISHQYVNMASLVNLPTEVLQGIIVNQVICIDNIDLVSASSDWQRGLFDFINQFVENDNTLLLMASSQAISQLELTLADLRTRLQWGVNFSLKPLNDEQKQQALIQHAQALGMSFQDDAIKFLLNRTSRDMGVLMSHLQALDKASLQNKRKVTIPFIKSTLKL